jgi:hypothetical protein
MMAFLSGRLAKIDLRDKLPPLAMHWFVRQQLVFARRQGLSGTRDLLNSLCLALMAGARFDQLPGVKELWPGSRPAG